MLGLEPDVLGKQPALSFALVVRRASPHGSLAQWVSGSVIVQLFAQVAWSSHTGDFPHGDHVLVAALPHLVRW